MSKRISRDKVYLTFLAIRNWALLGAIFFIPFVTHPTGSSASSTTHSIVLAETSFGTITAGDLERQLVYGQGLDFDEEKPADAAAAIADRLRTEAYEQIMLKLAEERNLAAEPRFNAMQEAIKHDYLIGIAHNELIDKPSQPTPDELNAYVTSASKALSQEPLVSWHHLLFEVSANPAKSEIIKAHTSATKARDLILNGASFDVAATRLGASGDRQTSAGALTGPCPITPGMIPELADMLRTLPVGTLSEVTSTPIGMLVVKVVSREAPPVTPRIKWQFASELLEHKKAEYQQAVIKELRGKFPVEIPSSNDGGTSSSNVVIRVGERAVTRDDLLSRSLLTSNPTGYLSTVLSPAGIEQLVEEELLLSAMDEMGVTTSPAFVTKLQWRTRYRIVEYMQGLLERENQLTPTDAELEIYLRESAARFTADHFDVDLLSIDLKTLANSVGSTYGLHLQRSAEQLLAEWDHGATTESLSISIGAQLGFTLKDESYAGVVETELPVKVRDTVGKLSPGQSDIIFNAPAVHLVRLTRRERAVPALSKIRSAVMAAYQNQHGTRPLTREEMLEKYGFKQIVPSEKIHWDITNQTLGF